MDKKIVIGIPILFPGYSISLPPPCVYCGRPGSPIYYYLQLTLSDARIARRFLDYFPGIKIYKGQNI